MKVLLTGASGFSGKHLARELEEGGHEVRGVSRRPGAAAYDWSEASLARGVRECDAIVHLAGEPIAGPRWNPRQKERLRASRVDTGLRLARLAAESGTRVLLSASGIGYYGEDPPGEVDESAPPGEDFLARLCVEWEAATRPASEAGVRTALLRTAVVLGREGGALPRLLLPFRLGLGGRIGSGRQSFPWIHVGDLARLYRFVLEHEGASGPFNAVAPEVPTNASFTQTLARVLRRPAILPVPPFALRIALGEFGRSLLTGQHAVPRRARETGFDFRHPKLEGALRDLVA